MAQQSQQAPTQPQSEAQVLNPANEGKPWAIITFDLDLANLGGPRGAKWQIDDVLEKNKYKGDLTFRHIIKTRQLTEERDTGDVAIPAVQLLAESIEPIENLLSRFKDLLPSGVLNWTALEACGTQAEIKIKGRGPVHSAILEQTHKDGPYELYPREGVKYTTPPQGVDVDALDQTWPQ